MKRKNEGKKDRKTGTWGKWKNEKWVTSGGIWTHNPQHSALQTDALTNWATKAAQLAAFKSMCTCTHVCMVLLLGTVELATFKSMCTCMCGLLLGAVDQGMRKINQGMSF